MNLYRYFCFFLNKSFYSMSLRAPSQGKTGVLRWKKGKLVKEMSILGACRYLWLQGRYLDEMGVLPRFKPRKTWKLYYFVLYCYLNFFIVFFKKILGIVLKNTIKKVINPFFSTALFISSLISSFILILFSSASFISSKTLFPSL